MSAKNEGAFGLARELGQRQIAFMAEAHIRPLKHIEEGNQAWSESVRRTKEAETEFAHRLADCRDPLKAAGLGTEWATSRAAGFLAESQRFTGLWLTFYSDAVKTAGSGVAASASPTHEVVSAERKSDS